MTNLDRVEINFKKFIDPTLEFVIQGIKRSGFSRFLNRKERSVSRHYNYNAPTEIWDAIRFEFDVSMTDCKIKQQINYKL